MREQIATNDSITDNAWLKTEILQIKPTSDKKLICSCWLSKISNQKVKTIGLGWKSFEKFVHLETHRVRLGVFIDAAFNKHAYAVRMACTSGHMQRRISGLSV